MKYIILKILSYLQNDITSSNEVNIDNIQMSTQKIDDLISSGKYVEIFPGQWVSSRLARSDSMGGS